jgi:hypothetical protein
MVEPPNEVAIERGVPIMANTVPSWDADHITMMLADPRNPPLKWTSPGQTHNIPETHGWLGKKQQFS